MLDESSPTDTTPAETPDSAPPRRRRAAKRPAGPPPTDATATAADAPADALTGTPEATTDASAAPPAKKAAKRAPRKKAAAAPAAAEDAAAEPADTSRPEAAGPDEPGAPGEIPVRKTTKRAPRKKAAAAAPDAAPDPTPDAADEAAPAASGTPPLGALFSAQEETPAPTRRRRATKKAAAPTTSDADGAAETADADAPGADAPIAVAPMFQAPDPSAAPVRRRTRKVAEPEPAPEPEAVEDEDTDEAATAELVDDLDAVEPVEAEDAEPEDDEEAEEGADGPSRRRRRRGGRRRRRGGSGGGGSDAEAEPDADATDSAGSGSSDSAEASEAKEPDEDAGDSDEATEGGATRRRRRRRRRGEGVDGSPDDPANTVVRVREPRSSDDEITSIVGSTRLEAKKQRRREGRDAGRRRAPIVSESEFLARRESVKREMIIRQREDLAQIAVLEDGVLVEHYVARESQTSLIGNVYLGRVQNVLPSMEAAFVDIGKGRNAVLYAGEVDWKALGVEGRPRKVEEVLKPGQTILVQVTKDPVGHKGARLTGQISLPGRYVVYVPGGQSSGISRKLSDTERSRLKGLLKQILPDEAGVIIRTAAENATEDQLTRDVGALTARWDDIAKKSQAGGSAPQLLYGEPDLMIKVVRDLFNEDFVSLVVQGDDAWDMIQGYVAHVAPDLGDRLSRWGDGSDDHRDVFAAHRVDEQIAKGLDRKVWLPSGGSLVIDRTEAMTVVDVNTGKFTGSGGNLEETVTKNNLEAAEEIVRQLRLRDIGGIIVVDFIDMVLENNRDLVLRRMVECLGRDRTRHQVAEVTSLGLVQMTRKKIGTGLIEAFSETCEHCHGRGLLVHAEPVEPRRGSGDDSGNGAAGNGGPGSGSGRDGGEGGGRRGRRGGRGRSGRLRRAGAPPARVARPAAAGEPPAL
jgi:ribonuclease E